MFQRPRPVSGASSPSAASTVFQQLNNASGNPGASSGRAQPQTFTRPPGFQTTPSHVAALALANWSVASLRVHADLNQSPPDQQRNLMQHQLGQIESDPRLMYDIRKSAQKESQRIFNDASYSAKDFQQFVNQMRGESLELSGNFQDARKEVFAALNPALPPSMVSTIPNGPQPTNSNFAPARQPTYVAPAGHGIGTATGSGPVSAQGAQAQATASYLPPHTREQSLALAKWALTLHKTLRSTTGAEQVQQISDRLLDMMQDSEVPEDFQQGAFNEWAKPFSYQQISSFEQSMGKASLNRAGPSRGEVQRYLEAVAQSMYQDIARQNQPSASMHGMAAASNAVPYAGITQGPGPSTMQGPMGATGMTPPVRLPTPFNGLPPNQNLLMQSANNANPEFSMPPERRQSMNPRITPRINEIIDQIMANPTQHTDALAKNEYRQGHYKNSDTARRMISHARKELAFGASEKTRQAVQTQLRSLKELDNPSTHTPVSILLSHLAANSNPLISNILPMATSQYIAQGGDQSQMNLEDLAPFVSDEGRRVYEAFMNKPEGYITRGPVSPGLVSVESSRRAMTTQLQPQQALQSPPRSLEEFLLMPMSIPAPGGTAEDPAASSATPNKRQRMSRPFDQAANTQTVTPATLHTPQQPIAPTAQQQPAPAAMPLGQQRFMPEQTATSGGQPSQALGSAWAITPQNAQPSQGPMSGNQAPLQQLQPQFQPQQYPSQPQQTQPIQVLTQQSQSMPQELQIQPQAQLQPQLQPQLQQTPPLQAMTQPVQQLQQPQVQQQQQPQQPQTQQPTS